MLDTPTEETKKGIVRTRQSVSVPEYEEVLNLVRNTLDMSEPDLMEQAGYSRTVQNKWRLDGNVPVVALNALRGLLLGHQLKQTDEREPLKLSTEDIEILLHALSQVPDDKAVRRLRSGFHREIARRLDR